MSDSVSTGVGTDADADAADTWHDYGRSRPHPVLEGALRCSPCTGTTARPSA